MLVNRYDIINHIEEGNVLLSSIPNDVTCHTRNREIRISCSKSSPFSGVARDVLTARGLGAA